eukprot:jgi/Mesvir1/25705/Mv01898-RA.1
MVGVSYFVNKLLEHEAAGGAMGDNATTRTAAGSPVSGSPTPDPPSPDPANSYVPLTLDAVRTSLMRQEDSIIYALTERAQFKRNRRVYDPSLLPLPGYPGSLLSFMLQETERLHGRVRRFTAPDEHPFFPVEVTPLDLTPMVYPKVLAPYAEHININPKVMQLYLDVILPAVCEEGDDHNYGSTATLDVTCLQALSKRIHYGKFVAEAKFQAQRALLTPLIRAQDAAGIMRALTHEQVEQKLLRRVEKKTSVYSRDVYDGDSDDASGTDGEIKTKISPRLVSMLYRDHIMPLTKEVQLDYLLHRLDAE